MRLIKYLKDSMIGRIHALTWDYDNNKNFTDIERAEITGAISELYNQLRELDSLQAMYEGE